MEEINGFSSLSDSSQSLEQRKRLVKKFHEESLKLSRHTVLHEELDYAIHRKRAEKTGYVGGVLGTFAAQTSEVEDGIQDLWSDVAGERHPAEEMGETSQRADTNFFKSWIEGAEGCVGGELGVG